MWTCFHRSSERETWQRYKELLINYFWFIATIYCTFAPVQHTKFCILLHDVMSFYFYWILRFCARYIGFYKYHISVAMCQHIVVFKRFTTRTHHSTCIICNTVVLPTPVVQRLGSALQWINHCPLVYYYQNPDSQNPRIQLWGMSCVYQLNFERYCNEFSTG